MAATTQVRLLVWTLYCRCRLVLFNPFYFHVVTLSKKFACRCTYSVGHGRELAIGTW